MKVFIWLGTLNDGPKCKNGSAAVVAKTLKEAVRIVREHEAEHSEYTYHVADLLAATPPNTEIEVNCKEAYIPGVYFDYEKGE